MAVMVQGFCTTLGSVGSGAGSILRPIAAEQALWDNHGGTFSIEGSNFGHISERVWTPNQSNRTFNAASSYAMFGFEGRALRGAGVPCRFTFANGLSTVVCGMQIEPDGNMSLYLSGFSTLIGITTTQPISSQTVFYTVECAFASTNPISCETRVNGQRIPQLTTTDFAAAGGQAAGTATRIAYASPVQMTTVLVNHGTLASPVLYYWWQKNHTAIWNPVVTGAGTSFAEQSDFLGIKKKFILTPDSIAAPFNTYPLVNWLNGAGTLPSNLADTVSGMDSDGSYIRNQTDPGGVSAANNRVGYGYSNLPAAATRVGMVQRNVFARTDQTSSGILARAGVRDNAGGTGDYFDHTTASAPNFSSATYSTGGGNFGTSKYYAQAPYSTGGTTVWNPTTVNAIHGIFEMVDIL